MDSWQRMQLQNEQVVLVNSRNETIGKTDKVAAHQNGGQLHRAITVFLTNPEGKILTTQRSTQKPLWPTWWDAAISTHQWPGEDDAQAAARRLPFEIGLKLPVTDLKLEFNYEYHAVYNNTWSENEVNYIFTAKTTKEPKLNPDEVIQYQWKTAEQITSELEQPDHRYAPWFKIAFKRLY